MENREKRTIEWKNQKRCINPIDFIRKQAKSAKSFVEFIDNKKEQALRAFIKKIKK